MAPRLSPDSVQAGIVAVDQAASTISRGRGYSPGVRSGSDRSWFQAITCRRTLTHGVARTVAVLLIAGSPAPVLAANCKSSGGLRFIGTTSNSSESVWLSATSGAGSFSLEAAQGSLTVDQWTKERRGLHISTSPVVSSGNGGTHKLFDTTDGSPCLIDTQNQKGGFTIPPNITLPPGRPGLRPPIGDLFPGFKPPIGTLPPEGITPGLPRSRATTDRDLATGRHHARLAWRGGHFAGGAGDSGSSGRSGT